MVSVIGFRQIRSPRPYDRCFSLFLTQDSFRPLTGQKRSTISTSWPATEHSVSSTESGSIEEKHSFSAKSNGGLIESSFNSGALIPAGFYTLR